jgi:hypothetical protein
MAICSKPTSRDYPTNNREGSWDSNLGLEDKMTGWSRPLSGLGLRLLRTDPVMVGSNYFRIATTRPILMI